MKYIPKIFVFPKVREKPLNTRVTKDSIWLRAREWFVTSWNFPGSQTAVNNCIIRSIYVTSLTSFRNPPTQLPLVQESHKDGLNLFLSGRRDSSAEVTTLLLNISGRESEQKLWAMEVHACLLVVSYLLASCHAGLIQKPVLEHPQQVFCKADFGEFCASLKILRDHGSAKVAMTMCQFRVYRDPRLLFYVAIFNRQPARLKRVLWRIWVHHSTYKDSRRKA